MKHGTLALSLAAAALLCTTGAAHAQTVHLITVADSLDATLGPDTVANADMLKAFMVRATTALNLRLQSQDVQGADFSCAKIDSVIEALKPAKDDVVMFHYSGHGTRTQANTTKFPELYCGAGVQLPQLARIAADLQAKGARLTIVTADACNPDAQTRAPELPGGTSSLEKRVAQYANLLLKHSGNVTMSGAVVGQLAWYYTGGGFFTTQLVSALERETEPRAGGKWEDVIRRATAPMSVPYGEATVVQQPEKEFALVFKD